jgi:hypothetical protein
VNAFGPVQWFLAGLAIGLLGCAAVWLLVRRSVAEWRERNRTYLTDREMGDLQRRAPDPFVRVLAAALRPLGWLLGTRDRAVYRATFHAPSWPDLCSQVEGSVRASDPGGDGFAFRVVKRPTCIIRAYRGMTSGFSVQLIPQLAPPGGANVLLVVGRWSRWHTWGVHVATAGFFVTLLGCVLALAVTGWQFPGSSTPSWAFRPARPSPSCESCFPS